MSVLLALLMQQAIAVEQVAAPATPPAELQVPTGETASPLPPQIAAQDDAIDPAPPPPRGDPSAPVPQLSRSDGQVILGRVEGIDRCSAELLSAVEAAFCARRLETRSGEFETVAETPLTAEQRLLGERLAGAAGESVEALSRRAGRGVTPEDEDIQALAAVTLAPAEPATAPVEEKDELGTQTEALIQAIVERLANPGGGG